MRKRLSILALGLLAFGAAGQARAGTVAFSGSLAVQFATPDTIAVTGSGIATVDAASGAHIGSLDLPASPFSLQGVVLPFTDPAVAPIKGVQATLHNAAGHFSGSPLGGTMSINGVTKVCLFKACTGSPPANISVPVDVVGVGGTAAVTTGLVSVTVVGAPWTAGTAAVGTLTQHGFSHGPASATSSTAVNSGALRLVTPIFISTSIGSAAVVGAFGLLDLHFVPEPATVLLVGGGVAGLVMLGRARRP